MKRLAVALLFLALLATPLAAQARPAGKIPRIAFLAGGSRAARGPAMRGPEWGAQGPYCPALLRSPGFACRSGLWLPARDVPSYFALRAPVPGCSRLVGRPLCWRPWVTVAAASRALVHLGHRQGHEFKQVRPLCVHSASHSAQ